jgi:hypothetical protein
MLKVKKPIVIPTAQTMNAAAEFAHEITTTNSMSFRKFLSITSADEMADMVQFLKHDKTNNAKKLDTMGETCSKVASLITFRDFLNDAIAKSCDLIHDAFVTECSSDDEMKISNVIKRLEIAHAVKSASSSMAL